MSPPAEERAHGVDLPAWWLDLVRKLVDERGEKLTQLGESLAAIVDRDEAWDHSKVSRFLRNINTTVPMTEAFSRLLGVPMPFVVASSLEAALALHATAKRYDEPKKTSDQARRLAVVDQARDAQEEAARDQTRPVKSQDERVSRGRGAGRATRRRSPAY